MKRMKKAALWPLWLATCIFLCACGVNHAEAADNSLNGERTAETATQDTASQNITPQNTDISSQKDNIQDHSALLTMTEIREKYTFSDVAANSVCGDAISYMAYRQILSGSGDGLFHPDSIVNGAQAVTALYRMSGDEAPRQLLSGIALDKWYAEAVSWAVERGIMDEKAGLNESGLQENVTRQQLALMLWNYSNGEETAIKTETISETAEESIVEMVAETTADTKTETTAEIKKEIKPGIIMEIKTDRKPASEIAVTLSEYADGNTVPAEEAEAVCWAVESGVYAPLVSYTICPNLPVSRGQLAEVLTTYAAQSGDKLASQAAISSAAQQDSKALANHQAIQKAVDAAAEQHNAVGVQVAVVEDGRVADTFQYGWAVKNQAAMEETHKIRVASLSKVVVGLGTMALAEEGVVDMDTDIGVYWDCYARNPAYPDTPVTIRSLLSHTSSIPVLDGKSLSPRAIRSCLSSGKFSRCVPGSIHSWSYNNYAFGILGATLETASGKTLDNVLHRRFFDVMDIDASFASGSVQDTSRLASIYRDDGSVGRTAEAAAVIYCEEPGSNGKHFAGGFTSSARDYAKIISLLVNDGCYEGVRLLSACSIETMESLQGTPRGCPFQQALPMKYQTELYGRDGLYYHTGSAYGVYNLMSYDPVAKDGVVVLTTGADGGLDDKGIYAVCGEISQYIYEILA